ncbi:PREDICTED: protein RNA-directed DNA methylation 3-like [Lupinus angustifolius]|uniref:protein RNA-directed DNA methylation 3-like n=1 Tax=Lupinus angustifolius TaxID=3871 RepID=UPI00092EBA2A|nr:PREDICTED: protein RNA-directed DNA methylation 3-like [Lupinus angustifolius]
MAAKFGGGYSRQKTAAVPAPRIISSSELQEFRPLIQIRRDRDTGKVFEVLDGMLLKDGYIYKKVSPDSLNLWGVEPTEGELLKFVPSENHESKDLEWLSQLYGDSKKKQAIRDDKGGEKGESSSGSGVVNGFELYDLVCFG